VPTSTVLASIALKAVPALSRILTQKITDANQVDLLTDRQGQLERQLASHASLSRLTSLIEQSGKGAQLEAFLHSADFNGFLLDVLAIVNLEDFDKHLLHRRLARMLAESGVADGEPDGIVLAVDLAEATIDASGITCDLANECGIANPQDLAACVNRQLIADTYASLRAQLHKSVTLKPSEYEEYRLFRNKYKSLVAGSLKYIRHPSLEGTISFDLLYVAPNLRLISTRSKAVTEAVLSPGDALSVSYRSVILGNPGAGKSTFATKLCHDLWTKPLTQYGSRNLVPILIVLKDYAAQANEKPQSFIEYVEGRCKVEFQTTVPSGAFERLCLTAEAVVIFDGLDELLDTKDRKEITKAVESFATNYPATPILVTSRERGYEQAPLDPERFAVFNLLPFNEVQVDAYVQRWFKYSCVGSPSVAVERAAAFMLESQSISDLRENPLMLALLCNLYRQDGYLPQFRPDVYQRCADLLFERWDKSRQIKSGLSVEYHLKPIMRHLAQWIYCGQDLQKGVTESQLLHEISAYLSSFTDSEAQASAYAAEFVEFLKGRAWVFSDTGSTENELLYTFTHRTFLEYFTAEYLVGVHQGSFQLSAKLLPHIEKQEWDIVCQLCYQMQARLHPDAADELISELLTRFSKARSETTQLNLLLFTARILKLLHPRTAIRTKAIEKIMVSIMSGAAIARRVVETRHQLRSSTDIRDAIMEAMVALETQGELKTASRAVDAAAVECPIFCAVG
jgi:hypothetical protein